MSTGFVPDDELDEVLRSVAVPVAFHLGASGLVLKLLGQQLEAALCLDLDTEYARVPEASLALRPAGLTAGPRARHWRGRWPARRP